MRHCPECSFFAFRRFALPRKGLLPPGGLHCPECSFLLPGGLRCLECSCCPQEGWVFMSTISSVHSCEFCCCLAEVESPEGLCWDCCQNI